MSIDQLRARDARCRTAQIPKWGPERLMSAFDPLQIFGREAQLRSEGTFSKLQRMDRDYSVPLAAKLAVAALAGAGVVLSYFMGRPEASLLFGVCLGCVGLAAFVRRDLRDKPAYWLLIVAWVGLLLVIDFSFGSVSIAALRFVLPVMAIALYVPMLGTFFLLDKLRR